MQGPPKINLRIKCFDLKNMDLMSKSDPQVFLTESIGQLKPKYLGKTEKINNNLSPVFQKPITIDYYFEVIQNLKFTVLDVDGEITDLDAPDYIGELSCTLGDIISKGKYTKQLRTKKGSLSGEIEITAEEVIISGYQAKFAIKGTHFDKKDTFGKSDPYYIISRFSPKLGENIKCFTSETIMNTLDPVFKPVSIPYETLNNCDVNTPIQFDFYDYDAIGKHDLIGTLKTTTQAILSTEPSKRTFEIINPKKNKSAGSIFFEYFELVKDPTFIDYIYSGTELNLMVAIDCTGSNGAVTETTSLHRIHTDGTLNQYESSILAVGNVLSSYDMDGLIPTYGFGGIVPTSKLVNHCFAFSFDESNPNAAGVNGLLSLYRQNISKIEFYGPTNFSNIIQKAISISPSESQYKYNILLILTDGEISDIEKTIELIVDASNHPLSIIIVGVGSANFDAMDQLDSDDNLLADRNGFKSERDIVQFVPFTKSASQGPENLAREVLKEVPNQLLSFMRKKGFKPTPKIQ